MWSLCWLLASLPWLTVWSPPGCSWQPVKQSRHKDTKRLRHRETKRLRQRDKDTDTHCCCPSLCPLTASRHPPLRWKHEAAVKCVIWYYVKEVKHMLYSCLHNFMGKYNCWNRRCSVYQSIFFCTLNIHTYFFLSTYPSNVVLKPLSETCMNNEGGIFYSPTTRMTVSRVHTLTAPSVLSERFSVHWEVIIKNVKNLISQC